jgi:hypothetical protein
MPLPNGVNPRGDIETLCPSAGWLGNRGILHDAGGKIVARWKHKTWIVCALSFKGRNRKPLMQPHRYTELFFLDEATAFAAGHRPCAECRRRAFLLFKQAWRESTGHVAGVDEIDRVLHSQRVARMKGRQTCIALLGSLPEGAMFELEGQPHLLKHGAAWRWSSLGYTATNPVADADLEVQVLTPEAILEVLRNGYEAQVHESAHRRI